MFLVGLLIGLVAAIIVFLCGNSKLNTSYHEYITTISMLNKDKLDEAQRADLLALANEELQEELNKARLDATRNFQRLDSLRAQIRRAGDARKYYLNVVEKVNNG